MAIAESFILAFLLVLRLDDLPIIHSLLSDSELLMLLTRSVAPIKYVLERGLGLFPRAVLPLDPLKDYVCGFAVDLRRYLGFHMRELLHDMRAEDSDEVLGPLEREVSVVFHLLVD